MTENTNHSRDGKFLDVELMKEAVRRSSPSEVADDILDKNPSIFNELDEMVNALGDLESMLEGAFQKLNTEMNSDQECDEEEDVMAWAMMMSFWRRKVETGTLRVPESWKMPKQKQATILAMYVLESVPPAVRHVVRSTIVPSSANAKIGKRTIQCVKKFPRRTRSENQRHSLPVQQWNLFHSSR